MALDPKPWIIGVTGAEHSAEVARMVAYAATGGNNGIISKGDLKVLAQGTPNNSVRVMPGGVSLMNHNTANPTESYIGRVISAHSVSIDPTTSAGGRSDLVVAFVQDPSEASYADFTIDQVNTYQYFRLGVIKGVSAGTRVLNNPAYPVTALARIDIPASTATITNAMITDVRQMTQMRNDRQVEVVQPGSDHNMATSAYNDYPNANIPLRIPQWCNRMVVTTHYSGIESTGAATGTSVAGFRGVLGNIIDTQNTIVKVKQGVRVPHTHTSVFSNIPSNYRGVTIAYDTQAQHVSGTGALQLDYQSTITYDAHFMEVPE